MKNIFYPDQYVNSKYKINYKLLLKRGIKGLVFDIDNTLEPFDVPEPSRQVIELIEKLKQMGFEICLLSNNDQARVDKFNAQLNLKTVAHAKKPGSRGIRKAMSLIGTNTTNTALIGDQVFTDVVCGRKNGIFTILVEPMSHRDEFFVGIKRYFEKLVIKSYFRYVKKTHGH